jgi:hypothetical protein
MVERMPERDADEASAESSDEIDLTLIDWFLSLSPWERLQASANWARLAALGHGEREDE